MRSYVFVEIGDEFRFPIRVVRIHTRSFISLVYTHSHVFANPVMKTCWFTHLSDFEADLWSVCVVFLLCS